MSSWTHVKQSVTNLFVQNQYKTLDEYIWFDVIRRLCLSLCLHCLIADNVITLPSEGGLMIDCGGMCYVPVR